MTQNQVVPLRNENKHVFIFRYISISDNRDQTEHFTIAFIIEFLRFLKWEYFFGTPGSFRYFSIETKAQSTHIGIFLKTHLFYPYWVRVHMDTAFLVPENEAFRKRSPEWIFLKTLFSCCHMDGGETELFENADITVSIYCISEHVLGSLGITRGYFAFLFSFIEVAMLDITIDHRMSLSNIEF